MLKLVERPNAQSFTPVVGRGGDRNAAHVTASGRDPSAQSGWWKSQSNLLWYWKAIAMVYTDKCANPCENDALEGKRKEVKTWWIYKGLYCITPPTMKWKSLFTYLFLKIYIVYFTLLPPHTPSISRQSGCTKPPRQHDGLSMNFKPSPLSPPAVLAGQFLTQRSWTEDLSRITCPNVTVGCVQSHPGLNRTIPQS